MLKILSVKIYLRGVPRLH